MKKRLLSIFLAVAVTLSAYSTIIIASAEQVGEDVVYFSADGTGDGKTVDTPTTLEDAIARVKNGGTLRLKGTIGDVTKTRYSIGSKDKEINILGIDKNTSVIESKAAFAPVGKIFFDNLTFKSTVPTSDVFLFMLKGTENSEVTIGEDVVFDIAGTGGDQCIAPDSDGYTKFVANTGTYKTIYAGGYNSSLNTDTDYIISNVTVSNMAIANGWRSASGDGGLSWEGNYNFTVNNSKVTKIVLGHLNGLRRTTKGIARVTVNEGSTVDAIYMGAEWKEMNSTGLRIAEINGGKVDKVLKSKETNNNCSYKTIVIFNNGTASSATQIEKFDTVITASKGGSVTAVVENKAVIGYKITTEKPYLWIDGVLTDIKPEGELYELGSGSHTVDFTDKKFLGMEIVYASQDGVGSGETAEDSMAYSDAVSAVKSGGTIYVVGEISSDSIRIVDKEVNIVGVDKNISVFKANTWFNVGGKISFDNLTFKTNSVSDFLFLAEKDSVNEITFGENVILPSSASNYHIAFNKTGSTNKLTVNNAGEFNDIYAGGYNNGGLMAVTKSEITVNNANAKIDNLAVARGFNSNGKWSGNYSFIVNDGQISNLVLGHTHSQGRTLEGTMYAVINGGTVGTVYTGPINSENNGKGVRIAEINGGNITEVRSRGGSQGTTTTKTVIIFNHGMADRVSSIGSFDTLIKASNGGKVTAVVNDNAVSGYQIVPEKDKYVLVDGIMALPDSNTGLYKIGTGTHIVEFADCVNELYISQNGTGNGNSEGSPTTFEKAMLTIKDGGTLYVVGQIGTSNDIFAINSTEKAINFVGTNKSTSIIKAGNRFHLSGKLSFDNLTFVVDRKNYDFSFYSESADNNDITFGENVIIPEWAVDKGYVAFLRKDSNNKLTINTGTFSTIYAGGYNGNLSGVNTDITLNNGTVNKMAIAHGWSSAGWNGSLTWHGNYSFNINGGIVNQLVLGHVQGGLRTSKGVAKAVINGGTVTTLYMSAANGDKESSGLRIAEVNGGNVGSIVNGENIINSSYKRIVILNNGMADKVDYIATVNTLIKASEGGKVTAKVEGNKLLGYEITTDKNYILIDGTVTPKSELYSIGDGEHEIDFVDKIPSDLRAIKVNSGEFSKFGQWVKLKADTEYILSYYYTENLENSPYVLFKDTGANNSFEASSMYVSKENLYREITFTAYIDDYTDATMKEFGLKPNDTDVMVYIGISPKIKETGYFYNPVLYEKSDATKSNLFADGGFYRALAEEDGGKWYDINKEKAHSRFLSVSLKKIEGGMDAFKRPATSVGDGNTILCSNGLNNPFLFQRVSLTTGKTYALSFYSTSGAFGSGIFTHFTADYEKAADKLITRKISDKEYLKTTVYFKVPQAGEYGAVADASIPGNVFMYIGVRTSKGTAGYLYDLVLYEITDSNKTNIFKDTDFEKIGYSWYQYYWEALNVFSVKPLSELENGMDYFKRPRGEDVEVPAGPKMMGYHAQSGSAGKLTIELPSDNLEIGDKSGKYYVVSFYIRPIKGRDPTAFFSSDFDGNPQLIQADSVDGYKYTFHLQQTYNFFVQFQIEGMNAGYISRLEMYEADKDYNIIGTVNESTFFGKDGTFSDWTVEPGLCWINLEGSLSGTHRSAFGKNFNRFIKERGQEIEIWTGQIVSMPEGYFDVEDYGEWWKEGSEVETGTVSGTVLDSSGKALSNHKVKLTGIGDTKGSYSTKTDKNGKFVFDAILLGTYELYVTLNNGQDIKYSSVIELKEAGDALNLNLNYYETVFSGDLGDSVTLVTGCIIKGKIADPDGNPIEGLILRLESHGTEIKTDADGYFCFEGIGAGKCELYIITEEGNRIFLTALELGESGVYELTAANGKGPLTYDAKTGTVSNAVEKVSKKDDVETDSFNYGIVIGISTAVVLLAGAAVVIFFVYKKKKSINQNNTYDYGKSKY